MVKKLVVLFLIFLLPFVAPAEEGDQDEGPEEAIRSIREERERTLKYGIDASVITLIDELKAEENDEFNSEILTQAMKAINDDIAVSALQLFAATEYRAAEDWARALLEDEDLFGQSLITTALRYLGEDLSPQNGEVVLTFLSHEEKAIAQAAIAAIGKSEDRRYEDKLIELIDDDDFHEELKPTVIAALGDLKSEAALELLTDIVEDEDEEKGWRWRACQALGKIGAPESFTVLKNLFSDRDKILRSYATDAIGYYDTDESQQLLMQALRDAAWEVRVKAAKQLGEREYFPAVDHLIYVSEEDPETNVKREALTALTKMKTSESLEFIRSLGATVKTAPSLWLISVEFLIEEDLDNSFEDLMKIVEDEWEKDNSYFLDKIAKFFSKSESARLKPVFERLLDHKEINMKLYGIRGIGLNGFSDLKERIEGFTEEDQPRVLRQNALDALENLQ